MYAEKSIHVTTHTYLRDVRKIIRLTESGEIHTLSRSRIRLCKHTRHTQHSLTKEIYARNTIRLTVAQVGSSKNIAFCVRREEKVSQTIVVITVPSSLHQHV